MKLRGNGEKTRLPAATLLENDFREGNPLGVTRGPLALLVSVEADG
jgi:hypothetical protein